MRSFETVGVHIDGKFGELTKDDVAILVIAHGGTPTSAGKSSILLAGEGSKKRDEFVAAGKEVISLADLGAPLEGWLDRLTRQVDALRTGKRKKEFRNFAFGAPGAASLVERVGERIGFEPPDELRRLLTAFDGLTFVSVRSSKPVAIEADSLLPPLEMMNATGPLWSAVGKQTASTINILPWEDVFFSDPMRDTVMPDPGAGELRIGKKTVANSDARRRLFPFDVYHWYRTAALYADPETKELLVLHTSDHGADLGVSDPIPLQLYMESLLAGGYLADAGARWAADPPGTMRLVRPRAKAKLGVPKSAVQPFQAIRVSA